MKITIIDGQGGGLGKLLCERVRREFPEAEIAAVGANSMATGQMLRAGASYGATGENAVRCNCRDADAILGAMGIIAADSMHGEISPAMAAAVSGADCPVILIPMPQCKLRVAAPELPLGDAVDRAILELKKQLGQ
jgi:hypothetical protein